MSSDITLKDFAGSFSRYNLYEEARRFTMLLAGNNVADDYARKYRFREGALERGDLGSSIKPTARTNTNPRCRP